ncbi:hypothetical protein [Halosolutus gelatinilyticus]|uniref:hypothetical protein n=1 Tax=Halosolutus gelatinilyticus TaxID=2931975 RepID=UPI001FF229B7|nr:hypothetical protein [Halosolutus gelatinilyticus]
MTNRHSCPSPDDYEFETDEISELTEHINSEHAGEYQREDWPDTEAGRAARPKAEAEDDEEDDGDDLETERDLDE